MDYLVFFLRLSCLCRKDPKARLPDLEAMVSRYRTIPVYFDGVLYFFGSVDWHSDPSWLMSGS